MPSVYACSGRGRPSRVGETEAEAQAEAGADAFTLDRYDKSTAILESLCAFGQNQLSIVAPSKGGASFFNQWVTDAQKDTQQRAPSCFGQFDLRDCKLTPLAGFGKQAYEFGRQVIVLTAGGTLIDAFSTDQSLTYDQLEAVVKALLPKVK